MYISIYKYLLIICLLLCIIKCKIFIMIMVVWLWGIICVVLIIKILSYYEYKFRIM